MKTDRLAAPTGWRLLRAFWPYAKGDRWLYGIALLAAPLSTLLTIAQPWLLKHTIDDAILTGDAAALQRKAFAFLGAVLGGFALETAYTIAISYGSTRTITRLRDAVYAHSLGLAQSWYDRVPTGKLLTRATSDIEALGETLTAGAITIVLDALTVVGILAAMAWMDVRLTGILLLVAPPMLITMELIRRILRRLYEQVRASLAELNGYCAERWNGVQVVQLYSDEARSLAQFDVRLDRYRSAAVATNLWDSLIYAMVDGLAAIAMALMLWYATRDWLPAPVSAGLLAAFIDYLGKLFNPLREFAAKIAILQRAGTSLEQIFGLLLHHEQISPGTGPLKGDPTPVALAGLSFAYAEGADVLKGIDLEIAPGQVVALVGRTGSGKTTIGKLLTRTYDGYRGSIRLGGQELSDLSPESVRRAIGVVAQDVQLFPGTVRFNLALGRELDDAALTEAIALAQAGPLVERLGGLDGRIEHRGRNVSVGEAQLLAFARTLAHDPPFVVLDEATASVDTLTEEALQRATDALLARKTVLVIAHRLSTVASAHRIAVLDQGRIAEIGSHAELLAQDGLYADLVRSGLHDPAAVPPATPPRAAPDRPAAV